MKPLKIDRLTTGSKFSEPLHDSAKNLLLAQGMVLTEEMLGALVRGAHEYVYLGEWNEHQFRRYQAASSLEKQRDEAERYAAKLREEVEAALLGAEPSVVPGDHAFRSEMRTEVLTGRSEADLEKQESIKVRGEALVSDVVDGTLFSEDVESAAGEVIDDLLSALQQDASLMKALTCLEAKSAYAYRHSLNLTVHSLGIAADLGLDHRQMRQLGVAAMLQDVGMSMVDRKVLDKPVLLSPSEFIDIQKHTIYSLHVIQQMRGLPYVTRFVAYQMHERADGSGYPSRRPKNLIHRYAQIAAVADVYDALINDRPWRKAHHPYRAMEILIAEARAGKFDPEIVRALLNSVSLYPVGCCIVLDTGETARVVHANGKAIDRPVVAILNDAKGNALTEPVLLDLLIEDSHKVVDIAPMDPGRRRSLGFC